MSTTVSPSRVIKHVGNRWLGEVPEDWSITRLRFICDVATGSGDTQDAEPDGEYDFYVRSPKPLGSTGFTFNTEAVLTAGDGAVGEVFHHVRGKFHAHQRVYVLTNFRGVLPRYFFYYFSSFFRLMAQDGSARTTVDSVRRWMLTDMPFVLPPIDEQRAIAEFLDHETAQIDALVAKQEELVTLLAERKRSVLDDVLAGVQGERCRLRWLYRPSNDANNPNEEVLSVYREHGVIPKSSRSDNFNKTPENVERYLLVRPDDLVVNKMKAWQGSLGVSVHRGIVSADYEVLRPSTTDLDPGFAHFLLRSPQMVLQYRVRSRGIRPSQWRLYWQDLADIEVSVPPLTTQRRAASQIKAETDAIDALISKAEEHISLARERRSALITAAATGQIDVRTARKAA
ncbi:restriction endonuclease subunit S [Arthrobacter sp. B10-11]|uniref:restriction endonuclease subunit S n=1 Tax=Arthrobacter sp. B10-11 TaxID=3081160 RepID=UPI0029559B52|nr:restriction endonuclease subunit S [Arthrobacter sp. B10-11]MDV8149716.1 restriction endonuclease subunit S [Arthrobacter sp. B10-11]